MLFQILVDMSEKVSLTPGKKAKVALIAELFAQCRDEEIVLAANYLSGRLPQGRLGIGWKMIEQSLRDLGSMSSGLSLVQLSGRLDAISREKGTGSIDRKIRALREIFSSLGAQERTFLIRQTISLSNHDAPFRPNTGCRENARADPAYAVFFRSSPYRR